MKKILLFCLALLFITAGCKKEDANEGVNTNASKIVGVWVEYCYWSSKENKFKGWGVVPGSVHEFNADNTYNEYLMLDKYKSGIKRYESTYTFDGEYLVLDGKFKEKITFSEDGNEIIWENKCICYRYNPEE